MSQATLQAAIVLDDRQQQAAALGVAVAHINANPEDAGPLADALERVLDLASFAPGGWNALIACIVASTSRDDVLAFCRAFTGIISVLDRSDELMPFSLEEV